jgi:hypothetical protein
MASAPMADDGRLFLCSRCRTQVVVCRQCDRGQIYCSRGCSIQARRLSQAAAGRRYQASRPGRFAHAARARRYRVRAKIVTHQGSVSVPADAVVRAVTTTPVGVSVPAGAHASRCCRCGVRCAGALRLEFLQRRRWLAVPTRAMPDDDCS